MSPGRELATASAGAVTRARAASRGGWFRRESVQGFIWIAPTFLYLGFFIAYPFLMSIYLSVSSARVGSPDSHFVGTLNYTRLFADPVFWQTVRNSFVFTFGSELLRLAIGLPLAFALNRPFKGKRLVQGIILIPFVIPIALSSLAWKWMFDSLYSVINWTLVAAGLIGAANRPQWLGQEDLAMIAVAVVHAWRLFPFGVVIFLAGFTSVPQDVLDAATIDGAGFWRRNYQIILPIIAPIIMIAVIFGTVFTFTDLSVVYLLTKGGPINSTQVLGSLAFQVGILSGDVAHGAAICLFLFPFLLVAVILLLRSLRRREI
jgi:multiple sugar transport system permease protein